MPTLALKNLPLLEKWEDAEMALESDNEPTVINASDMSSNEEYQFEPEYQFVPEYSGSFHVRNSSGQDIFLLLIIDHFVKYRNWLANGESYDLDWCAMYEIDYKIHSDPDTINRVFEPSEVEDITIIVKKHPDPEEVFYEIISQRIVSVRESQI